MNRFFGGINNGTGFNTYVRPNNFYQPSYTQPQTMIPNQTNIIWVDNEDQIATYPTGRGWQQWFGNKNEQILYVRDTDSNGVTQPVVKLKYEVVTDPVQPVDVKQQDQSAVTQTAPSREEFDKLTASVNMMLDKLGDLLK